MRFLPAVAALIAVVVAVLSVVRGDWGVVVVSVVLCAIAVRAQLLIRRDGHSGTRSREGP